MFNIFWNINYAILLPYEICYPEFNRVHTCRQSLIALEGVLCYYYANEEKILLTWRH